MVESIEEILKKNKENSKLFWSYMKGRFPHLSESRLRSFDQIKDSFDIEITDFYYRSFKAGLRSKQSKNEHFNNIAIVYNKHLRTHENYFLENRSTLGEIYKTKFVNGEIQLGYECFRDAYDYWLEEEAKHHKPVSKELEEEINRALGMVMTRVNLGEDLVKDLQMLAEEEGIAYQAYLRNCIKEIVGIKKTSLIQKFRAMLKLA